MQSYDVIIAGGGPVGLGLAIDLGQRGISVLVVERRYARQPIPKGQNLTQRTGEHFKAWGIQPEIRAASPIPRSFGNAGAVAYRTLLGTYAYDWLNRRSVDAFYAAETERLPQYHTEAVMRDRIASFANVEIKYDWTVSGYAKTAPEAGQGQGVVVTLTETDGDGTLSAQAQYLVACDGAGSRIRDAAGISQQLDLRGKRMVLAVIRSPEMDALIEPRFPGKAFFNVLDPDLDGYWQFLGRVDLDGRWFFHRPVADDATAENLDVAALLQAAIGAEFQVETEHLGFWNLRFAHANSYRAGRVFVAGDAAHAHPPYGGFGVNTGFEDVRNLSWKLEATMKGWGSDALLDSYTEERHPVFASTRDGFIAQMIEEDAEFLRLHDPARDRAGFEAAWAVRAQPQAAVMNFLPNYAGASIVEGDGRPSAVGQHSYAAKPGFHLTPAKLADGTCIYDQLGATFSLIVIGAQDALASAASAAAHDLGIPLRVIRTTQTDETQRWEASAILVRPDHFVAAARDIHPHEISMVLAMSVGKKEPVGA